MSTELSCLGAAGRAGNIPIKTGGWAKAQPAIDAARCNLCLLCWVFCPDGTIERRFDGEVELPLVVDEVYCKGCGICERECPRNAITMVQR